MQQTNRFEQNHRNKITLQGGEQRFYLPIKIHKKNKKIMIKCICSISGPRDRSWSASGNNNTMSLRSVSDDSLFN